MRLLIITQKIDESDDVLGFFTYWVRALAKKADNVDVICLAKGKYDLPKNVRVFSLGKEKGLPKFIQGVLFYFHAMPLMFRASGVFVHMAPEYVSALYPINIFLKKPIVMWYAHIKVSPVAKWAMSHVNFILTPSKESFSNDSPKVVSTGHGINTEIFKPINQKKEFDVISISRISKVKRIEVLIEAVRILVSKGKKVSVNIYGKPARLEDGEYLDQLKSLVEKYGIKDCINWPGSVSNKDASAVYQKHRIFVRMQGGGGFGKTELESMASGVPVILPTEVYKNYLGEFAEETYFLEDDADALANRIEGVLGWDEEKLSRYTKLARDLVVERHNVENVAGEIVKKIKSCAV